VAAFAISRRSSMRPKGGGRHGRTWVNRAPSTS
jgi:hypothetical protein